MRKVQDRQMMLGEVDISQIKFDGKSRDEIPQLLRGLQYIYCTHCLKDTWLLPVQGDAEWICGKYSCSESSA